MDAELSKALNHGILPADHYALAEQIAGAFGPDVLTLQLQPKGPRQQSSTVEPRGGVALAEVQPKVSFRVRADADLYAKKAKQVVVRHVTNHRDVAMIEIVSPGNKDSRSALRDFVEKATALLRRGVHLLVLDLFPPASSAPQGIHKAIWDEFAERDFILPPERPLILASYIGGMEKEGFIEPAAVGKTLADMPLFLTEEIDVSVPLEQTYEKAWDAVPAVWQKVMES